ncbi:MAG: tRNA (guanosine(37)-N1)-methyltransferase TrmD [Rickettsiales bacterium]
MQQGPWHVSVITLMPQMWPGPLAHSLIGDALARELWRLSLIDLRQFGIGAHQKVDDTPYGGGAGMVLKPDVVDAAITHARQQHFTRYQADAEASGTSPPIGGRMRGGLPQSAALVSAPLPTSPRWGEELKTPQLVHFTPRGEPLRQQHFRELASRDVILLCGRYEAIDQRVLDKHQPLEISLGDFILTGGDIPAMALVEGIVRLLPGVVGAHESLGEESFGDGDYAKLLEYPHYTKPATWDGHEVPPVLTSGNHAEIAKWRRAEAEATTRTRRPDLLK